MTQPSRRGFLQLSIASLVVPAPTELRAPVLLEPASPLWLAPSPTERSFCSFCGASDLEYPMIVAGPLAICAPCLDLVFDLMTGLAGANDDRYGPHEHHCSRCGLGYAERPWIVQGPGVYLCDVCSIDAMQSMSEAEACHVRAA